MVQFEEKYSQQLIEVQKQQIFQRISTARIKHYINNSMRHQKDETQHQYEQLSTQQLLRMANRQTINGNSGRNMHHRSLTMPQFDKPIAEESTQSTTQLSRNDKLQQENMILAAEKQNISAELIFYKNELAKLCLRHSLQFPVFRPTNVQNSVSTAKQLSCSSSTDGNTSKLTNRNSQSQIISELATPAVMVSPNMFYHKKQVSDSRYLHMSSQGGLEDQASTTLSQLRFSKNSHVLKARDTNVSSSIENPTIIRHERSRKLPTSYESQANS